MLVSEGLLSSTLLSAGPTSAGREWARATAESIRQHFQCPPPESFPGLLADAHRVATRAGVDPMVGAVMYETALKVWRGV